MNKSRRKAQINTHLRKALNQFYSSSGMTQKRLAEKFGISPRACSALQNGEYGFSALSVLVLFSLLSPSERIRLLNELCAILLNPDEEAA